MAFLEDRSISRTSSTTHCARPVFTSEGLRQSKEVARRTHSLGQTSPLSPSNALRGSQLGSSSPSKTRSSLVLRPATEGLDFGCCSPALRRATGFLTYTPSSPTVPGTPSPKSGARSMRRSRTSLAYDPFGLDVADIDEDEGHHPTPIEKQKEFATTLSSFSILTPTSPNLKRQSVRAATACGLSTRARSASQLHNGTLAQTILAGLGRTPTSPAKRGSRVSLQSASTTSARGSFVSQEKGAREALLQALHGDSAAKEELGATINHFPVGAAHTVADPLNSCESLIRSLESGAMALLKATALAEFATAGGSLPRRQDLPTDSFHPYEDMFEQTMSGTWLLRPGREIISVSHCWLASTHPDPEGTQIAKLARFLKSWVQTQPGLVLSRVAIVLDWSSLMQSPFETSDQERLHKEALQDIGLWYAHRKVRVWILSTTPSDVTPRTDRGWPLFEESLATLKAMLGDEVLDIGRSELGSLYLDRGWPVSPMGLATLVDTEFETLDPAALAACRMPVRPCLTPKLFQKELGRKVLAHPEDTSLLIDQYTTIFHCFGDSVELLNLSHLDWGDLQVEIFAESLPFFTALRELSLRNNEITELGAGELADFVGRCPMLQKLFLTDNDVQPGLEGSERLLEEWTNAGKNRFWLFLSYPEQSAYIKSRLADG